MLLSECLQFHLFVFDGGKSYASSQLLVGNVEVKID